MQVHMHPSLRLHLHKPCMHPHPLQSPHPIFLTLQWAAWASLAAISPLATAAMAPPGLAAPRLSLQRHWRRRAAMAPALGWRLAGTLKRVRPGGASGLAQLLQCADIKPATGHPGVHCCVACNRVLQIAHTQPIILLLRMQRTRWWACPPPSKRKLRSCRHSRCCRPVRPA